MPYIRGEINYQDFRVGLEVSRGVQSWIYGSFVFPLLVRKCSKSRSLRCEHHHQKPLTGEYESSSISSTRSLSPLLFIFLTHRGGLKPRSTTHNEPTSALKP